MAPRPRELCLAVREQDARGRLCSRVLGRGVQPAPCPVRKPLPAPARKPLLRSPAQGTSVPRGRRAQGAVAKSCQPRCVASRCGGHSPPPGPPCRSHAESPWPGSPAGRGSLSPQPSLAAAPHFSVLTVPALESRCVARQAPKPLSSPSSPASLPGQDRNVAGNTDAPCPCARDPPLVLCRAASWFPTGPLSHDRAHSTASRT